MSATTTIITVGSPSPEGFPLSAQQRRIWANDVASCVQAVIAIDGPLERDRLCAALERVVGRHQALRTTFHRTGGLKLPL